MKISREVKTAILAISAIALFIFGFNYLKGKDILDNSTKVYTKFENSFGLVQSAPVSLDGLQVGKVVSVANDYENGGVIVVFSVNDGVPFTKTSTVKLIKDLLGGISLALVIDKSGKQVESGDYVKNMVGVGLVDKLEESLAGISTDLTSTLKKADSMMTSINTLINDDSDGGLKAAIAELTLTMKSFKNTSYTLNGMIKDDRSKFNKMIDSFAITGAKFGKVADSLEQARFGETMKNLNKTLDGLNGVLADLKKGKGSMGKLLTNDSLYNNLSGSTKELEALLKDIKLHPKRYFRILSKKEIPYKEEE
ncbi:MAG: MCE family protein [Flavobacteriaceae bacterium]|nr:MCE family protein [Flavobacteriaceae bacterium]